MKPLILSFFAVILCYSLLTNNKNEEAKAEPIPIMDENSVYFEVQPSLQPVDSVFTYKNELAVVN